MDLLEIIMQKVTYKVPKGKMLRLQFKLDDYLIKDIKITGDFFIHPEKTIIDIEKFLINIDVREVEKKLSPFIKKNNIKLIGFKPKDLQHCLLTAMV